MHKRKGDRIVGMEKFSIVNVITSAKFMFSEEVCFHFGGELLAWIQGRLSMNGRASSIFGSF